MGCLIKERKTLSCHSHLDGVPISQSAERYSLQETWGLKRYAALIHPTSEAFRSSKTFAKVSTISYREIGQKL